MGILTAIEWGFRFLLFAFFLSALAWFETFLIGKIPPLHLDGCLGYYAKLFGFVDSFRLFLSIIFYGFTVRFTFSYFMK